MVDLCKIFVRCKKVYFFSHYKNDKKKSLLIKNFKAKSKNILKITKKGHRHHKQLRNLSEEEKDQKEKGIQNNKK